MIKEAYFGLASLAAMMAFGAPANPESLQAEISNWLIKAELSLPDCTDFAESQQPLRKLAGSSRRRFDADTERNADYLLAKILRGT